MSKLTSTTLDFQMLAASGKQLQVIHKETLAQRKKMLAAIRALYDNEEWRKQLSTGNQFSRINWIFDKIRRGYLGDATTVNLIEFFDEVRAKVEE